MAVQETESLVNRVYRPNSFQDENSSSGHLKVIDALENRDVDAAEYIMRRHIQEGKKRRIEAFIGKIDLFEE
jgi:DNA-binding GntR family transcriptional regulator